MEKIKISEVFGPAGYWIYKVHDSSMTPQFIERYGVTQGEGKYVGKRSVFLRTFGCNFTCPSFGLHHGEHTSEPDDIGKTVHLFKSISELPAAKYGCDSYYSWHSDFKHLSPMLDVTDIAKQVLSCAGGSFFSNPSNPVHLILTGGEPMLGWQRAYVALVKEIKKQDCNWSKEPWRKLPVTFETNGTQKLIIDKITNKPFLFEFANYCDITWSVSAKLTASGHSNEEAILPDVVASYLKISNDMYLKFVVHDANDLDEVDLVVEQFSQNGVDVPVYIMPEGGVPDEYKKHATLDLVAESVRRGYDITPRLHVMIGDNQMSW